jgi:hypothetical protein
MSDDRTQPRPPGESDEPHDELPVVQPDQPSGLRPPGSGPTEGSAVSGFQGRTCLRTHVIWIGVAILLAIGVGAAGYAVGHHSGVASVARSAQAQADAACSATSRPAAAQTALLDEIAPPPAGASPLGGAEVAQVLQLDQIVKQLYSGARSMVPVLKAFCVKYLAQAGWQTPNEEVVIYLVQTGSPADAQGFALLTSALLSNEPNTVNSTVPGGVYFGRAGLNSVNRAEVQELGIKGSVAIIVNIFTPLQHLVSTGPAAALLTAQKARLPA